MEICNPDASGVGYDGTTYGPVPGSLGHVFDVPQECGVHLLRMPGWRYPGPSDWPETAPGDLVEGVPPFPDLGSPYVREPSDPGVTLERLHDIDGNVPQPPAPAFLERGPDGNVTRLLTTTQATPPVPEPSNADIRAWAAAAGLTVSARGAIPATIRDAYTAAHQPD